MTHLKVLLLIRILFLRGLFCLFVPRVKLQGDCTKKLSVLYVKILKNKKKIYFFLTILDTSSTYLVVFIHQYSALRPVQQEPEPSQVTGMALARCILGKFLGVGCHCFPPAFRRSHLLRWVSNDARDLQQRKVELFVGEKCSYKFWPRIRLPCNSRDLLHAANLQHGTDGFTSPPKEGFFALKNPTTSAGFEPANLGTKGQHTNPQTTEAAILQYVIC